MNNRLLRAEQLLGTGQFEEAEKLCRSAIKLGRDAAPARRLLASCLYNRSVMLLGNPDFHAEAEALLREATQCDPRHIEALNNLAALLLMAHRPAEAIPFLTALTRQMPADTRALENLALAQEEADQHDSASATLRKLAELDPANGGAYLLREALLMPAIPPSDEFVRDARNRTLAKLRALQAGAGLTIADPLRFPSTYFRFSYHGHSNVEINRLIADIYAKACPSLSAVLARPATEHGAGKRIRIGIVSRFLRTHSVGSVARGFIEKLDRTRFEVIAVRMESAGSDELAREIDRLADSVIELPAGNLAQAREVLAALALDVLFYQDIGMEPFGYFLSFSRVAPVQLTWFGHPDTTGIANLDAYVSTGLFDIDEAHDFYTEKLISLVQAGNMSYYHRPPAPGCDDGRQSFGLEDRQHIYCCPQLLLKIQPVMDRLFLGILERDPDAVILLFESREKHWRLALEKRFAGLSPLLKARVRFLPAIPYQRFLRLLQLSDVVLDTVTFNGFNTTLEAFSVGTPVITLPGKLQRERFGYGLYSGMGFMELVAKTESEYIDLAIRVAADRAYRNACSAQISQGCGVLFENIRFIRDFEDAIAGMVTRHRAPG